MPATLNLSTMPGSIEHNDRYSSHTVDLFGGSLGRESVVITTVADIRTAVERFGDRVRADHPDASFAISVTFKKGDRKPRGFDDAYKNGGLGQHAFMHVVDKRTMATTPGVVAPAVDTSAATPLVG